MPNAFKKRLDLSCIITKTWSGKEVYLECIRKQRVLGNLIHNALQNVQIKDNIHEYYEEYCNAIYETCKDFLSKESPVFSPFQKKNAFWFDSSDTKMKHLLKSRDLLADFYSAKPLKF